MQLAVGQEIGRFKIVEPLGSGGQGQTYRAEDLRSGDHVALKSLTLAEADAWKSIELFEREAAVLASIDHPSIPKYVDYIANDAGFFLIQELVDGRSLFEIVKSNRRFDEEKVVEIATTLLEVLVYLHSKTPPIIHRDIKPQNVLLDENGDAVLVDFGAVKNAVSKTYASTMVGTYGYMAPEQYQGDADERSDLYSLGATLVFLATGKEPHELPKHRLKIDFESSCNLSDLFAQWLGVMIEMVPDDRFDAAHDALRALIDPQIELEIEVAETAPIPIPPPGLSFDDGPGLDFVPARLGAPPAPPPPAVLTEPDTFFESEVEKPGFPSRVEIEDLDTALWVNLPRGDWRILIFSALATVMLVGITAIALAFDIASIAVLLPMVLYGVAQTSYLASASETLILSRDRFVIERMVWGIRYTGRDGHSYAETAQVEEAKIQYKAEWARRAFIGLTTGPQVTVFQVGHSLTDHEREFVVQRISDFIDRSSREPETEFDFENETETVDAESWKRALSKQSS